MEVILLEKFKNLGNLGDKVNVTPGYGRNFLIPMGHALPATGKNLAAFEVRRAELEKQALDKLTLAQKRAENFKDLTLTIEANTSEEGKLFGSIGIRELIIALKEIGQDVEKREVLLPQGPLHYVGASSFQLLLHPDVRATIKVNVIATTTSY